MWLTKQLGKDSVLQVKSGRVTGGAEFAVQGENKYQSPEMLFPYGFVSTAAQGEKAVMLDGYCAGISSLPDTALNEGEVRLYSSGGAEILLKNSGEVVINGKVFQHI